MLPKWFKVNVQFLHRTLPFSSQVPMRLQQHEYFDNLFTATLYIFNLSLIAGNLEN